MFFLTQLSKYAIECLHKINAAIKAPVSVKNLRLSALMIAIHQLVISNLLNFLLINLY